MLNLKKIIFSLQVKGKFQVRHEDDYDQRDEIISAILWQRKVSVKNEVNGINLFGVVIVLNN